MRPFTALLLLLAMAFAVCGCTSEEPVMSNPSVDTSPKTFGEEVAFLKRHTDVIVLSDSTGQAQIAVVPALQGRVMTSTSGGITGPSFGWINRQYFDDAAAGKVNPHMSPYGGEDRIWLGPEGGQFALFFKKGDPFDLDHWFTPKFIDVEPFQIESQAGDSATFHRRVTFNNYSGTPFDIEITRTIRLIVPGEAWRGLGMDVLPGVRVVAFESQNTVTNDGQDWKKESGLLSIWSVGMFNASPQATVVIPMHYGEVNDDYFGKVPPQRLKVVSDNTKAVSRRAFFKADANFRSKIGIPPEGTKPLLGSYDAANHVLTLIQFTFDNEARQYVNSAWKIQDNPYGGDVINSYNDGPPPTGKPQLGKFYEIETSSPAKELGKGDSLKHNHRTIHLQADEASLDKVAQATLGVGLKEINDAFTQPK
jgi:hypothetical protein